MKVLVIDDDVSIHQLVKKFINPLIEVECETNLPANPKKLSQFDLVILDLWLEQDKNSLGFLALLVETDPHLLDRIILLTGAGTIETEVQTHKLGVRDYMKKPFDPRVFSAVIDKHLTSLKRASTEVHFGPFHLDLSQFEASVKGDGKLELTNTEFKILKLLVESKGRIVTRERLMSDVWDLNEDIQTRTMDMHISTLRKKLGKGGELLKTKRGIGYYLSDE